MELILYKTFLGEGAALRQSLLMLHEVTLILTVNDSQNVSTVFALVVTSFSGLPGSALKKLF